ncbi:hypothetical protein PHJA_001290100 [Phtheirospermum japonicum]|uniref:RING-type domain-containing protein n=1 Tax=Phtheirospermum japonicum TaxID=374723 RepID=A0A830CB29_9LAMI|nr:hypothetical protein PHJA_001290100 [Phtheirospermum japonicum]
MAARPEHANLNLIPVVVNLEVITVQQEKETFDAAMDRAIGAHKLVPLYLWPHVTNAERNKPRMTVMLMNYLSDLERIRVEDVDQGLALMQVCGICDRKPCLGAQISVLACKHAFHPHCLVRLREETPDICPICSAILRRSAF